MLFRSKVLPDAQQVMDYELSLYDTQPPAVTGLHGDFLASARLDNLMSCFVGLKALLAADGEQSCMLACTDHEEVGSASTSGAEGTLIGSVLERWMPSTEERARAIHASMMVSVDNAHAVHPNFGDKHDGNHGPVLNGGPVLKVNANQRYASNSETQAVFRQLCAEAGVPVQAFVVRSDMACGSTIGPIVATRTGIRAVDVGIPQFAMHSIRETCGSRDPEDMCKVLSGFFRRGTLHAGGAAA